MSHRSQQWGWTTAKVAATIAIIMYVLDFTHGYISSEKTRTMRREAWTVARTAKFCSESSEGDLFIYPRTGDVILDGDLIPCSLTGSHYVWRFPKNSSSPVMLLTSRSTDQQCFYACSDQPTSDGRRVFVFPPPLYAMILKDSDVDWTTHQLRDFVVPKPL